tara:strand:+ start:151 stop:351 length:201 start_codon:yes stop_codon:yes gene_type:complete
MSCYIATRDDRFGFDTTSHWNRKRGWFQSYLSAGCLYPTNKGAARTAEKLSKANFGVTFTIEEYAA